MSSSGSGSGSGDLAGLLADGAETVLLTQASTATEARLIASRIAEAGGGSGRPPVSLGPPGSGAPGASPPPSWAASPRPTVSGHAGTIRSLRAGPLSLLVFVGRVHLYEGHPVPVVVHGVRTAVAAGCRVVVLTNAAAGIRDGLRVGQPVLIRDHLNLTGRSPLTGPPPPAGYPGRFTDLTDLYAPRLRALAREADQSLAEGVYAALPGPHYETPAEIRYVFAAAQMLVGISAEQASGYFTVLV